MLESVVCTFGWINPLLGTDGSIPLPSWQTPVWLSPLLHFFACVCVSKCVYACVSFTKNGLAGVLWPRWWMDLFWFWNEVVCYPSPCVCVQIYSFVCLENYQRGHASVSSLKIWISWSAWSKSMFVDICRKVSVIALAQKLHLNLWPDFQDWNHVALWCWSTSCIQSQPCFCGFAAQI